MFVNRIRTALFMCCWAWLGGAVTSANAAAYCQVSYLRASDVTTDQFYGIAAAIDGDYALVGASADNQEGTDSGSVYVLNLQNSVWVETAKLTAADGNNSDAFGIAVDLSVDYAIIGANNNDDGGTNSGCAYIFKRTGDNWAQESKLIAADDASQDQFGLAVAIDGDYAVIGSSFNDDGGADSGSAYVFNRVGTTWTQQAKLLASDDAAGDRFGYSVDIQGDEVFIGAFHDDDDGGDSGSVYVFERSGVTWTQQQKLTADDAASGDAFGSAVAVSDDDLVIGAENDDAPSADSGSAYVFVRDGGAWIQQVKLQGGSVAASDAFGHRVAIDGDDLVVGAYHDNNATTDSGSVYIFQREAGIWTEFAKLVEIDEAANDNLGAGVAVDSGYVLAGAPNHNDGGGDAGAVYAYFAGVGIDCNLNDDPDVCDIVDGASQDCTANGIPDECDISAGLEEDCGSNGIPDSCEPDCNVNGQADSCDIFLGASEDCGEDGIPDECLAELLLFDDFASGAINPLRWVVLTGATVDTYGVNEPSEPYTVRLNGDPFGGDELQSLTLDISAPFNVVLSYYWQRTGGGASPETGDDLIVEYRDAADVWHSLVTHPGAGPDMTSFNFQSLSMPLEAHHADFALRFRSIGAVGLSDDWFVDNISLSVEGAADCNLNGVSDACDVVLGDAEDCAGEGVLDACEDDCNGNGIADSCDIAAGISPDCDGNGSPDACDYIAHRSGDCDGDGIIDPCDPNPCISSRIRLLSNITPFELGASAGNSIWAYVSPTGREYAIMGLDTGTSFIEVTDPMNPAEVAFIDGPNSTWRDMKAYDHYAYAVSEAGDGIQVMNLDQIDAGIVTFLGEVTTGGTQDTHTLALNEESGYLYRSGGGNEGIRYYSLANPALPLYAGEWSERYCHETTVITYPDGTPYAGREIAFCCGGADGGFEETGLYIVDVTNKASPFQISYLAYPLAAYAHQGWPSPDLHYFYINDEFDETTFNVVTNSHVIDISDLENPFEASTFTNGNESIDHNLYTLGRFIFEANYTSGLRVFDATDPIRPVEIGYYDTWPQNDDAIYDALWNNYPYLPSGVVIGSDISSGLYVWDISRLVDCNENDVDDGVDIADGHSRDCDLSRIPDECEFADCNSNCLPDYEDVGSGASDDGDDDGVPDECQGPPPCDGDANGDGSVDPLDAGYVQARFGCAVGDGDEACDAADVNDDNAVDPLDSGYVLARFGDCE